jgi:hypothetical protein
MKGQQIMMIQPIFDMHAVAAQEFVTEDLSQGFLDKLMNNFANPAQPSDVELIDEMLDRAVSYDDSQPSFAADLRAAVIREDAQAVA